MVVRIPVVLALLAGGCGRSSDPATAPDANNLAADAAIIACSDSPASCAAQWEQATSDTFDGLLANPAGLQAFLKGVPKGGDLHNHLSGAVYAETVLGWASDDHDCINTTTHAAVTSCGSGTQPVPTSGTFFDQVVGAWSMEGFVAGAETGHDHFFATFGKFGTVVGIHRDDTIADVLQRAADENQLYVETMFNLGKNVGSLGASLWSGTLTSTDLQNYYDMLTTNAGFAAQLASDVAVVNNAAASYKSTLGCSAASPPAACSVGLRFVAQVSRTGANDLIFGQLISAFEMAKQTHQIVAANLSSPEDDSASLSNYELHMAMLDFLHTKYAGSSPLHVTLHAGERTAQFLPSGSTDNTFHIRDAVEKGHAERIGHGIDIESETDPAGLLDEMHARNVLVEVCLSSNAQILEVSGAAHPLAQYLAHDVPVALATDDQGVSRSSLAGEYLRAALDQHLTYRQLKTLARNSLEHAFLPGASLWTSVSPAQPVADCAATDTMAVGGPPSTACAAFLATSERATLQWELEHRFLAFESQAH
jgi:adenosine deaminase